MGQHKIGLYNPAEILNYGRLHQDWIIEWGKYIVSYQNNTSISSATDGSSAEWASFISDLASGYYIYV